MIRGEGDWLADALQKELDEGNELFRQIAEAAGAECTSRDDWRALKHPPKGVYALQAVRQLRDDYDEALEDCIVASIIGERPL